VAVWAGMCAEESTVIDRVTANECSDKFLATSGIYPILADALYANS
jgi:hypothetical protein